MVSKNIELNNVGDDYLTTQGHTQLINKLLRQTDEKLPHRHQLV